MSARPDVLLTDFLERLVSATSILGWTFSFESDRQWLTAI